MDVAWWSVVGGPAWNVAVHADHRLAAGRGRTSVAIDAKAAGYVPHKVHCWGGGVTRTKLRLVVVASCEEDGALQGGGKGACSRTRPYLHQLPAP